MKSQTLTKAQVAGILVNEFRANHVWLQVFLLCFIISIILNLVMPPFIQVFNLVIILVQMFALYSLYNSNRVKAKEFEEKYAEEL